MPAANRSVLVSGIGIAGPTLAHWLTGYGFEVTLVERAPELRTGGYVIDFWGLGFDVAERMGLLPGLKREGYRVEELRFVDDSGRRVGGFGVDVFSRLTRGRYLSLPRSELAGLIYASIESRCESVFGDSIAGIEQDGAGVQVQFEHSRPRRFDLVIGADGLHSAVRSLVFGGEEQFERYLGYVAAAFEIEGYRPRDEGVYVSYCRPGRQVARFALRGDRTMILLVYADERPSLPDPHDIDAHKRLLHEKFADAGWECSQILAALEGCRNLYFDPVSQIHMDEWSKGRVALVGDAAFCPSLLAGQGTALAMTAAYVLAGELARADGRPEQAFPRYEALLRSFIAGKQKSAAQFAGSFAPRTSAGLFVRNQVTKLMRIPFIADMAIGRGLVDRLELPDYPAPQSVG